MEVSVENTGGLARRMTVQVPAERVDAEVRSRLNSMAHTIRLDGFRPGKVPPKVLEKKFGRQVRAEVVDKLMNTSLQEAFAQNNIRPAGAPSIEPRNDNPGEPLEFVATFEVFPQLTGPLNYGFSVSRPVVEIEESDIDGMLETLRRQRSTWSRVERAAQSGDRVVIDFEGSIDGQTFPGGKADGMPVELGSGRMIKGFEEQLEGLATGEEKTLAVTFPADYHAANLAGKDASFAVKVKEVSERVLPELDDEFARAFGITEGGIQGLRDEVTRNMRRELKGLISSKLKSQVFDKLLEHNPVEAPGKLIADEVETLKAQPSNTNRPQEELEALAGKRVRLGVIVSEVAKQNQIQIDPARVRDMIDTIAASYEKPEEVVQWYYGNQEMLYGVQSTVIEEQVVEWIVDHGGVTVEDVPMAFNDLVEEARRTQGN